MLQKLSGSECDHMCFGMFGYCVQNRLLLSIVRSFEQMWVAPLLFFILFYFSFVLHPPHSYQTEVPTNQHIVELVGIHRNTKLEKPDDKLIVEFVGIYGNTKPQSKPINHFVSIHFLNKNSTETAQKKGKIKFDRQRGFIFYSAGLTAAWIEFI